ncbi:MAG: hypothetical protein MJ230_01800 [bacterium]|nr:hypothetical protein [bacterium]
MPITTIANMQIVPEKFAQYTIDRQLDKNEFVKSGIAVGDSRIKTLINGTPQGGRFIELPMWNALDATEEEDVFGETEITVDQITTKSARATLLIRQKGWGATDLAHVLGGADPMGAIAELVADYKNTREQAVYLAELKGILDGTNGCLKDHVLDITSATTTAISNGASLDARALLGDNFAIVGMVFMHSATYHYLLKNSMLDRVQNYDPFANTVDQYSYLGNRIKIDDTMPFIAYEVTTSGTSGAIAVTTANIKAIQPHCATTLEVGTSYVKKMDKPVYETYFLGTNSFVREEGLPQGLIGVETDRDKAMAEDYLYYRWCNVITPYGISFVNDGTYTNTANKYPANIDLATPTNWELTLDHKKIPIVALKHTL